MTGRREFPKAVCRDAFVRAAGRCEGDVDGRRCGAKLTVGKFAYDHRIPDRLGGEPVLSNCQVLCDPCHLVKTRQDAKDIARNRHMEDAHRGIADTSRQKIHGQGFRKLARKRPASDPVGKLAHLPRNTSLGGAR